MQTFHLSVVIRDLAVAGWRKQSQVAFVYVQTEIVIYLTLLLICNLHQN